MPQVLYRSLMGDDFERLPEVVRAMHLVQDTLRAEGVARVTRGGALLARLIGRIFAFPPEGDAVPVIVSMQNRDGVETWQRDFGGTRFSSHLSQRGSWLIERFGPIRFAMVLTPQPDGLSMPFRRWWLGPVPMPRALLPRGVAREYEAGGRFHFDVPIALPLVGPIIHYRGWLVPAATAATPAIPARSPPKSVA